MRAMKATPAMEAPTAIPIVAPEDRPCFLLSLLSSDLAGVSVEVDVALEEEDVEVAVAVAEEEEEVVLVVSLPLAASSNCFCETVMAVPEVPQASAMVLYVDPTSSGSSLPRQAAALVMKSPPLLQRQLLSSFGVSPWHLDDFAEA